MGAGITSDAFHMVAPAPGRSACGTRMTAGDGDSRVCPRRTSSTSTRTPPPPPIGDIGGGERHPRRRCGNHAAVYAPKSALGHSIGAVGALESVLTVLSLRDGVIPPTLNYETPDPEIDLDVVAGEPRYGDYRVRDQQLLRIRWAQRRARLRQVLSVRGGKDHRNVMTGLATGSGLPNVVVTGVAMTTALATDAITTWQKLLDGQSGIRKLEDPFVEEYDLPVRIGGHLLEDFEDELTRIELRRLSYLQKMSTVLSRRVWKDAGDPKSIPSG